MRNVVWALLLAAVFLGGCCGQSWYVYRECDLLGGAAAAQCGAPPCEAPCAPVPMQLYRIDPGAPMPGRYVVPADAGPASAPDATAQARFDRGS